MSPRPYRLVVFDFDGTLADSFPWFAGIINGVADRYGFARIAEHETETLRSMDARAIVRHLGIPAWKLPLITRHMHRLAARDIAAIPLFPGVPDLLAELDGAGLRLGIASSNREATIRRKLGPAAGRFTHYACGAALFGKARRLRALIRDAGMVPSEVLYVGDEIRDHQAATEAGCAFGAVAWGYSRAEALAARAPAHVFSELAAIRRCVVSTPPQAPGNRPAEVSDRLHPASIGRLINL
ncbi:MULTISPECIES: HAD-IA family hydrolase [Methylobacterium]|uniref:HAD-IA family hydrolase n=1 Tax=Methylobacterium TaxID=407 RepID=UPI0009EAED2C|nr:HAD-IA family hydrolase [Methylobacterium sp. Leaf104]MCI9879545.1 HAD-IA family hydrolase [Methylobacterium goesingense]